MSPPIEVALARHAEGESPDSKFARKRARAGRMDRRNLERQPTPEKKTMKKPNASQGVGEDRNGGRGFPRPPVVSKKDKRGGTKWAKGSGPTRS